MCSISIYKLIFNYFEVGGWALALVLYGETEETGLVQLGEEIAQ